MKYLGLFFLIVAVSAAPQYNNGESLFTFKDGRIGVNFLGYRASAGLGGLLTGNAAHGGLHAEAGTPFGQHARAGLGGITGESGSSGFLYSGATAGGGVGASAGLGGIATGGGSVGGSFSEASAGGSHITKVATKTAIVEAAPVKYQSNVEFVAQAQPVVHKEVEVVHEVKPVTTLVEKTIIPNYVEKTIQVPSYEEKVVRVPTVVEKTIRVPVEPTIVEKTVAAPVSSVYVSEPVGRVKVVEKTKIHSHPHKSHIHVHKHFKYGGGYGGGYGGAYAGAGGIGVASAGVGGGVGSSGTYSANVNPEFYNDIFNIPISTLTAVNKLVSGIAGGTSGSVSVSKSAYASI